MPREFHNRLLNTLSRLVTASVTPPVGAPSRFAWRGWVAGSHSAALSRSGCRPEVGVPVPGGRWRSTAMPVPRRYLNERKKKMAANLRFAARDFGGKCERGLPPFTKKQRQIGTRRSGRQHARELRFAARSAGRFGGGAPVRPPQRPPLLPDKRPAPEALDGVGAARSAGRFGGGAPGRPSQRPLSSGHAPHSRTARRGRDGAKRRALRGWGPCSTSSASPLFFRIRAPPPKRSTGSKRVPTGGRRSRTGWAVALNSVARSAALSERAKKQNGSEPPVRCPRVRGKV